MAIESCGEGMSSKCYNCVKQFSEDVVQVEGSNMCVVCQEREDYISEPIILYEDFTDLKAGHEDLKLSLKKAELRVLKLEESCGVGMKTRFTAKPDAVVPWVDFPARQASRRQLELGTSLHVYTHMAEWRYIIDYPRNTQYCDLPYKSMEDAQDACEDMAVVLEVLVRDSGISWEKGIDSSGEFILSESIGIINGYVLEDGEGFRPSVVFSEAYTTPEEAMKACDKVLGPMRDAVKG